MQCSSLFHSARFYSHFRRILNVTISGAVQVVFCLDLEHIRVIARKTGLQMETAARGSGHQSTPPTKYRLHHPRQPRHAQTLTHTRSWIRGVHSDNRQAGLASRWSRCSKKSRAAHERAGAFVFVDCHTSSRGKAITGPGRALKLEEGVWGQPLWLRLMSDPIF